MAFIAGNIQPELYQKLRQKYPEKSDTNLIIEGLSLLLQHDDSVIKLNFKPEIWNQINKRIKEVNRKPGDLAAELLWHWSKDEIKI
jgi:hypothetical protein